MIHPSPFVSTRDAPAMRTKHCDGGHEHYFSEAAVQLAFAMHLLDEKNAKNVQICPDGQHLTRYDLKARLLWLGFELKAIKGSTSCGGVYHRRDQTLTVNPSSGLGDVSATIASRALLAECKGGVINSTNPGQISKLRKGLHEAVGQLVCRPVAEARQIVVVPDTSTVRRISGGIATRLADFGIEIALVSADGRVIYL